MTNKIGDEPEVDEVDWAKVIAISRLFLSRQLPAEPPLQVICHQPWLQRFAQRFMAQQSLSAHAGVKPGQWTIDERVLQQLTQQAAEAFWGPVWQGGSSSLPLDLWPQAQAYLQAQGIRYLSYDVIEPQGSAGEPSVWLYHHPKWGSSLDWPLASGDH